MTDPKDDLVRIAADRDKRDDALDRSDEPPVVARLVIEIRSDGTRTIARGAGEDSITGEKVAIEVKGTTPLQLALSLLKSVTAIPSFARTALKSFALKKGDDEG